MYKDLKDKVAVVTGARRGMGKSHALALANSGAKVIVSDIFLDECQEVIKEIKKSKGDGLAVKCDVSKKEEVDAMFKKVVGRFGKVDILVNNAGIAEFVPFLEMTEGQWDKTIDINLKGYFLCAQAAAREMVRKKLGGAIVNIASVAMGQQGIGFPNIVHYCASKGGIVAMTEALSLELAPYNIRVNAISPGVIETPMISSVKQDERTIKNILMRVPLGRIGRSEEISNVVLFLASEQSSYMTGSTIVVDGGWLAG